MGTLKLSVPSDIGYTPWSEIARNLFINPRAVSLTGFGIGNNGSRSIVSDTISGESVSAYQWSRNATAAARVIELLTGTATPSDGSIMTISGWMKSDFTVVITASVRPDTTSTTGRIDLGTFTLTANTWRYFSITANTMTATAASTSGIVFAIPSSTSSTGVIRGTKFQVERGAGYGSYINPTTADTDLQRTRWAGATDASQLYIETRSVLSERTFIGDIAPGWRINETASPIDPASDGDGVGTISVTAVRNDNTPEVLLRPATLSHDTLGAITGTIDGADEGRVAVGLSIVPLGALLNAERTLPPVIGATLRSVFEQYVASVTNRITVNWLASSNPTRTYPGWTGNVLYMLNRLANANKVEIAHSGSLLTVRDFGSTTLDLSNVSGLVVRRTARNAARKTRVTRTAAVGVPAVKLAKKTNYTPDPNAEQGWYSPVVDNPWIAEPGFITSYSSGQTATQPISGAYSFYFSFATVGTGIRIPAIGHLFGGDIAHGYDLSKIATGGDWAVSMKFRGPGGSRRYRVELEWRDVAGSALRTDTLVADGVYTTTLRTFSGTSATYGGKPANATQAALRVLFISQTGQPGELVNGDVFLVDDAMLTDVTDTTFFDIFTPGAAITGGGAYLSHSPVQISTGLAQPMWDAYADSNQVIQVEAGRVTRQVVQTASSWSSLTQPTYADSPPVAFFGEYIVSDSDRRYLTAQEWSSFGGKVEVTTGSRAGELVVTVTGPASDIPGAPGPYSLSVSDGQSDYAVLSVLGVGVITAPETIEVYTGASDSDTTTDYAPDVESPFITSLADVYEAGAWSGQINGGLSITLEGTIPTDLLPGFGLSVGALVRYRDCRYRIRTVEITRIGASIVADWFTTIEDHDSAVVALTQADLDSIWGSKRTIDYEIAPLRTS